MARWTNIRATVVPMREVPIRGETIRLGQLLKLCGAAGSGAEAKELLAAGGAIVNGEPETRRGRQLHAGDVVEVADEQLTLVAAAGS
jgi:ribosome-associated protein